jgi:lipoate-protein ligase B
MDLHRPPCLYIDIALIDYEEALDLQRSIVAAKKEKRIHEDIILFLEHPPVFTLGRNGGRENLVVSEDFLRRRGVNVVQIERGGNITYHGPGQLVAYPILDLNAARLGVRDYVDGLETVMIRTAGQWGAHAAGHPKNRGVWIGTHKLGSIGITLSKGICFHGLALNVNTSLEPFTWINPCGLHNIRMTSMKLQLSEEVPMKDVRRAMKGHMEKFLDRELVQTELSYIRELLK